MIFTEILTLRGVPFRQGAGQNVQVNCPFCVSKGESPDARFRLGINLNTQEANCFNCGWSSHAKGPVLFLRQLGMVVEESVSSEKKVAPSEELLRLPPDFMLLADADGKDRLVTPALKYLQDRGITKEQMQRHKIGVSFVGRYAYRILFPIAYQKRLRMLVGRDFTKRSKLRYLNSPGEKVLFGLVGSKRHPKILLSEGIFKALALEATAPDWSSAALLGHDITPLQLEQLKKYKTESIALWPDPDRVGIRGVLKVGEALVREGFRVSIVPPATQQADELTSEERLQYWAQKADWSWAACSRMRLLK